ncbi:hypothetical protein ALI22I_19950 [Saccharothrix sp. ALI-22-I]|uniref:hypothetical protein n=1 Tax=Saccharothrix sp. ALI-22-I TaxID=1933778 RepID=UPI0009D09032|nr:hypothetical protein [Saccharothrix sp. ALI-22-I]ONI88021.1 hypothetical protein ALI22I_19950 [Saccharothrix sp. ALI-22-I]
MAIARIDHSGRVGDRWLAEVLGWRPGDRHDVRMLSDGAIVSIDADGRFRVNARHHVFVPAGVRRILSVESGDPVVLVARPKSRTLLVHSTSMVASLLFRHYTTHGVFHG